MHVQECIRPEASVLRRQLQGLAGVDETARTATLKIATRNMINTLGRDPGVAEGVENAVAGE
jgi:hypothetical protein